MIDKTLQILILIVLSGPVLGNDLKQENWKGSYTPYRSDSIEAEYIVTNIDAEQGLTITMILDLEPREDFTYEFEKITVKENKLTFAIKKTHETKSCELEKQLDGAYVGTCKSDVDTENKRLTEMLMIPPDESEIQEKNDEITK